MSSNFNWTLIIYLLMFSICTCRWGTMCQEIIPISVLLDFADKSAATTCRGARWRVRKILPLVLWKSWSRQPCNLSTETWRTPTLLTVVVGEPCDRKLASFPSVYRTRPAGPLELVVEDARERDPRWYAAVRPWDQPACWPQ